MKRSSTIFFNHEITDPEEAILNESEEWILFKRGDMKAFESIFKSNNHILINCGLKVYDHLDFVEDCIQEMFTNLWQNRDRLGEVKSVKYYLIVSLRRLLFKKLRNKKKMMDLEEKNLPSNQTVASYENELILNEFVNVNNHNLAFAVQKLPVRQREAIELKFFQEKTYDEIVTIMSINYQSARKFIYKGIMNLKKNLKKNHLDTFYLISLYTLCSI
ncbi:MAG: sigma-70 family RNA polymerase sigma factor [Bacteroidota bacterium]|nr:sigma-70 family RNA polymerase sigma factor [Bacteroidota bacterium]